MPRFNVNIKGDYWACFSTISDSFISTIMHIDDYEQWLEQHGNYYNTISYTNKMTLDDALEILDEVRREETV